MSNVLITPAASYPVTLAEAKASCRVEGALYDATLDIYIAAATEHVENYLGRAIMPQTWALYLDAFPDTFMLTRGPVMSVTTLKYYDAVGALQTIDPNNYALDNTTDPAWVVPVSTYTWPEAAVGVNNVILTYQAGYASPPAAIRQAILLLVAQWFDNRSDITEKVVMHMPNGVSALIENHRSFAA